MVRKFCGKLAGNLMGMVSAEDVKGELLPSSPFWSIRPVGAIHYRLYRLSE